MVPRCQEVGGGPFTEPVFLELYLGAQLGWAPSAPTQSSAGFRQKGQLGTVTTSPHTALGSLPSWNSAHTRSVMGSSVFTM